MLDDALRKAAREDFDQDLDRIRNEGILAIEAAHPEPLPAIVYHYGRCSTVEHILRNRCIWATEGNFLNDTSELHLAWDLIGNYVSTNHTLVGVHSLPWTRENLSKWGEPQPLSFLASFSAEPDLLSQWRAYADDGGGVALGFDLSTSAASGRALAPGMPAPLVRPCVYEKHDDVLRSVVEPQLQAARAFQERGGSLHDIFECLRTSVCTTASLLALVLKNEGFREEREWRMVAVAPRKPVPDVVRFRDTRFGPAPYVEIPLVPSQLKRLGLGPRTEPAVERSFRIMLDRYGCNAEIYRSAVSYR